MPWPKTTRCIVGGANVQNRLLTSILAGLGLMLAVSSPTVAVSYPTLYGRLTSIHGNHLVIKTVSGKYRALDAGPNSWDLHVGDWIYARYRTTHRERVVIAVQSSRLPFVVGVITKASGKVLKTAGRVVVLQTRSGRLLLYEGPYEVRVTVGHVMHLRYASVSHVLVPPSLPG